MTGPAGAPARLLGEVAEFDVHRAGDMTCRVLAGLADVEHGGPGLQPVDHLRGLNQGHGVGVRRVLGPGGVAAVQFTGEGVEADLRRGGGNVGGVLFRAADDDHGPVRGGEPSEPGGEDRAERDGEGAGDVPGGVVCGLAGVDDLRALPGRALHGSADSGVRSGLAVQDGGAAPVDLPQAKEVVGKGAQRAQQRIDEGVFAVDLQQRVGGAFGADGGDPVTAAAGGAEGAGPVGGPDRGGVGEFHQPLQGPVLGPGQGHRHVRADQVGAPGGADHQRASGEDPGQVPVLEQSR